ncbi:PREDICTED: probable cyclic nucleotide-gated ion channel 20, chloroplastic [Tarenaya hassleriana]|uniref:probable cyclic nucleotide-gated ion channel 20, chloroplastic n=1 Tax=Tarenaya hassleriana TaxID=28532 RepID=UPI00053C0A1F|nr:PREDICTED: probable cyclic nucleotide-gated ion channel 20, chloroplastic [Tarenaya hassleriana]
MEMDTDKGKDEIPMLSAEADRAFTWRQRSASLSNPPVAVEANVRLGFTGPLRTQRRTTIIQMSQSGPLSSDPQPQPSPSLTHLNHSSSSVSSYKNSHLLRSGQLGLCNDPYCTVCPSYYTRKPPHLQSSRVSALFDSTFHHALYDDAKGWATRLLSSLHRRIPGVMNPHARIVQRWTKFFAVSCLLAIFVDPLFFFLLLVQQDNKCIVIDWPTTRAFVSVRSITDFIYFLHILLQFRLAYVAPETRVVGAGELVDHPKKIARHYLRGKFFLDLFVTLPLPQILILWAIPKHLGMSGANDAKNLLRAAVLVQYIPKLYRFLPLIAGQTPTGFIFESAWANFVINLLTFMLAGHVVGSCWYLFGLQRVNQCLRDACRSPERDCKTLIDCGHGNSSETTSARALWRNDSNAVACFQEDGFSYGIYLKVVNLTSETSLSKRYIYSLFWGFQQISTLAGNQVPSYFVWEVLFTMGIIGLGLLLFALLIGNMQNFLQALGRRRLEMTLRRRDVEQWMSHRRLPEDLRKRVREAERFNWAATRGVKEEILFENLPEDLQRDIRRHLFKFLQKVRIFSLMGESILDAIRQRLRQRTYIRGSNVLHRGGLVEKMVFIVRGEMESIGEDGSILPLSEGDVCGEELLTWCLERSAVNTEGTRIKIPSKGLLSSRSVTCVTNVEAFSLSVADLEDVTSQFSRFLRNPRVKGAIRYESPYWRLRAAMQIQVAWRYRKRRLGRIDTNTASCRY